MTWPRFVAWRPAIKQGKGSATLICMRLADMTVTHPRQDESRTCAQCGERVGIYPSGQKALKANPALRIVCARCAFANPATFGPDAEPMPAGPIEEIRQEARESVRKA